MKGAAPYNGMARLPMRLAVMSTYGLTIAVVFLGAIFGIIYLVSNTTKLFSN